jgi:drug/metabolite transporter (DMT)-like permease
LENFVIGLLILARIGASSWMNVLQKQLAARQIDPLLIVTATFVFLAFLVLPFLAFYPMWGLSAAFWINMFWVALLDAPGNFFLVKAIKLSELSVLGPLNSYKPVVALVVGILLLGEVPTGPGLAGVVIIVAGSFLLTPVTNQKVSRANLSWFKEKGTLYRLLSMVMTACSSIFLKAASQEASPMHTFVAWAIIGVPVSLACLKLFTPVRARELGKEMIKHFIAFLWLGALFLVLQILTLQLFSIMKVAYALALFQLNSLTNVFLGWKIFREKNILPRAIGSVIMIAGAAILILA